MHHNGQQIDLASRIHELNFNPYWTVPVSIIRKDLIPKMKEDPEYLAKNQIRIFDWSGNEMSWQQILSFLIRN